MSVLLGTFYTINLLHKASKKHLYSQHIWSWFWLLLFLRGIILSTFAIPHLPLHNYSKVYSDKIFQLFLKSLWECVLIHCQSWHCYHFLFLRWAIFSVTSPILSFAALTWNKWESSQHWFPPWIEILPLPFDFKFQKFKIAQIKFSSSQFQILNLYQIPISNFLFQFSHSKFSPPRRPPPLPDKRLPQPMFFPEQCTCANVNADGKYIAILMRRWSWWEA